MPRPLDTDCAAVGEVFKLAIRELRDSGSYPREVGPSFPNQVLSKREEARNIQHLLTHFPYNPFCDACVRGKMKHPQHRRGGFQREAKVWGEHITMDHMIQRAGDWTLGIGNKVDALTIYDVATKWIRCIPTTGKDHVSTLAALNHVIGRRIKRVKLIYFDNAAELQSACNELGILTEHSIPGDPQSNGVVERVNQSVLNMTRTSLLQSGLPHCFWPYAVECSCFNLGVNYLQGESSWSLTHKTGEFDKLVVPFGCAVLLNEHDARDVNDKSKQQRKWDPKGTIAVFAGYELAPCDKFSGYLAWPLTQFVGKELGIRTPANKFSLFKPVKIGKIQLPEQGVWFPLKERYDFLNGTLHGMELIHKGEFTSPMSKFIPPIKGLLEEIVNAEPPVVEPPTEVQISPRMEIHPPDMGTPSSSGGGTVCDGATVPPPMVEEEPVLGEDGTVCDGATVPPLAEEKGPAQELGGEAPVADPYAGQWPAGVDIESIRSTLRLGRTQ